MPNASRRRFESLVADALDVLPDRITLFRSTIETEAGSDEELRDLVADTVVHEVAHHFGITDERLADLGWE